MDMFSEAMAIKSTIEMFSLSQSECAKRLGVSQGYIANKLRLLKLSGDARIAILDGGLSERHARLILKLKSEENRLLAIKKIRDMHLSVVASEVIVANISESENEEKEDLESECVSDILSKFEMALEENIRRLSRNGIYADIKKSFEGTKEYITVVVDIEKQNL